MNGSKKKKAIGEKLKNEDVLLLGSNWTDSELDFMTKRFIYVN